MATDSNTLIYKLFGSNAGNTYKPIEFGDPNTEVDPASADVVNEIRGNVNWEKGVEGFLVSTELGLLAYTSGNIENSKFLALDALLKNYIFPRGIFAYSPDLTYNENSYCFDVLDGKIYHSIVDDNVGNALSNTSFWKDTGKTLGSYLQDDTNLIFNSEFFNTRHTLEGVEIEQKSAWVSDGITGYRDVNAGINFIYNILTESGQRYLRYRIPDSDTAGTLGGVDFYVSQEKTISLRGKTMTIKNQVRLGTNWNTTNSQGAVRCRIGYTDSAGLVGEVNGDLALKQNLSSISSLTAVTTPTNPTRNEWLELEGTFVVPNDAFNIIFTFDGLVNAGDTFVTDKVGNPGAPNTFYMDIKQMQFNIGSGVIPYKPTGYIESYATTDIKELWESNRISLMYNSSTTISYSAGYFKFNDNTGYAYVEGSNIDFTTNGLNGLDTGSFAGLPSYSTLYVFAIYNPSTKASGLIASLSKTSPTLPSGFILGEYLGIAFTNNGGGIMQGQWFNRNKKFLYNTQIDEPSITVTNANLPITVPPNTFAILDGQILKDTDGRFWFYSKDRPNSYFYLENDWEFANWSGGYNNRTINIMVDNNAEVGVIEHRAGTAYIYTKGWIETESD